METSGYWIKIPGARPYYVRRYQTVDTRRGGLQEYGFQNTLPSWLAVQNRHVTSMLQSHNHHVSSRKRPSSDATTLSAGGKRMFSRTESNPAPILPTNRKQHLDNFFKSIALDKKDKKASKSLVDKTLRSFMSRAFSLEGGRMYRQEYFDAGSYPVKMKISKADEFDVNIPLNIDVKRVRIDGKVHYCFTNAYQPRYGVSNLNVEQKLHYDSCGTTIPPGYAVTDVDMEIPTYYQFWFSNRKIPTQFVHDHLQRPHQNSIFHNRFRSVHEQILELCNQTTGSNRSSTMPGCIELIPIDVKRDLFEKMKVARCLLRNQNVSICKVSHGPALKMTIRPGLGSVIRHDVNVDITVSMHCDIPLSAFGWPREETKRAFDMGHINKALKAGIHLVPKKDLFWAISFSKAEKALLSSLDADQGCRKYVVKILKKYVMTCTSQSANGLPGISSHIIKTQILWCCEAHSGCLNYWSWENRDICLINSLEELEKTLTSGRQQDYFNPDLNILEGKDTNVLTRLASFLNAKRIELLYML